MKELHKSKKLSNYRLLYSAVSNFKEVDIPKSMLIKGICTTTFLKVFFRVQEEEEEEEEEYFIYPRLSHQAYL